MNRVKDNLDDILNIKNITNESADLYIYGNIVSSWWGAWDNMDQYPAKIKNLLDGAKGKKLNIYINSGGGSVFAGMAIYNMIKRHDAETTTYIDGIAGSIASVIALASDRVIMPENATFFVHKPLVQHVTGNADTLRKYAEQLDSIQDGLMAVYEQNLAPGITKDEVESLVNKETYLNAKDASKYFKIELTDSKSDIKYVASMFDDYEKLPDFIKEKIDNKVNQKQAQAKLNLLKLGGK